MNNKKKNNEFMESTLPKSGRTCICEKLSAKKFIHKWFDNKTDAVSYIKDDKNESKEFFFAPASFIQSERKQKFAKSLRVFFLDIDCGPGKPYATRKEGKRALKSFCEKANLPLPALVKSGTGLHAYWKLTKDIDAETWIKGANKLKQLISAFEPGLDNDGIVMDSARLLRPVGTFNKKDSDNPKKVTLIKDRKARDYAFIDQRLDSAIASLLVAKISENDQINDGKQGVNKDLFSAKRIAECCPIIKQMKETKGNIGEPLWYAIIGVLRHCEEAPEIIHDWSKGHPKYTRKETDAKIAQHKKPPTTCKHFNKIKPKLCEKCEHYGLINSPVVLGKKPQENVPEYIVEMNRHHFVMPLDGKVRVWREYYNFELGCKMIEPFSFADFKNLYCNKKVRVCSDGDGEARMMPVAGVWLNNKKRREYSKMGLFPDGAPDKVYNSWYGFSIEPVEGRWVLMKKHIKHVICNSDMKAYGYVIRWLARMFQQPGKVGEVALVIKGEKGVGKGIFVDSLHKIMGVYAMKITNPNHMTGNFNAHLQNCILLNADEAFWAGNKKGEGVLKGLVTERIIAIERKGFDVKSAINRLHIIMTSNLDWVVPASYDERRYCVLEVSSKYMQDEEYFKELKSEIENGGAAAMLHYLLNLDISDFNVRKAPVTKGLIEQKIESFNSVESWWFKKLQDGELIQGYRWGEPVSSKEVYDDYVELNKKISSRNRSVSSTAFGKQLSEMLPEGWPKKPRSTVRGSRVNTYEFPSLKLCRKHFSKRIKTDHLEW